MSKGLRCVLKMYSVLKMYTISWILYCLYVNAHEAIFDSKIPDQPDHEVQDLAIVNKFR